MKKNKINIIFFLIFRKHDVLVISLFLICFIYIVFLIIKQQNNFLIKITKKTTCLFYQYFSQHKKIFIINLLKIICILSLYIQRLVVKKAVTNCYIGICQDKNLDENKCSPDKKSQTNLHIRVVNPKKQIPKSIISCSITKEPSQMISNKAFYNWMSNSTFTATRSFLGSRKSINFLVKSSNCMLNSPKNTCLQKPLTLSKKLVDTVCVFHPSQSNFNYHYRINNLIEQNLFYKYLQHEHAKWGSRWLTYFATSNLNESYEDYFSDEAKPPIIYKSHNLIIEDLSDLVMENLSGANSYLQQNCSQIAPIKVVLPSSIEEPVKLKHFNCLQQRRAKSVANQLIEYTPPQNFPGFATISMGWVDVPTIKNSCDLNFYGGKARLLIIVGSLLYILATHTLETILHKKRCNAN
uniref:Uncharacterized protein n=1 Tax=Pleurastrum terricola TaxID=34116 RepID=A6YGE3_PLETE|nr:hypothetical protein LeteCp088 [Pleurastrum terricola]ABO69366.1 hypothetical protein [Pleurastrum terricola]